MNTRQHGGGDSGHGFGDTNAQHTVEPTDVGPPLAAGAATGAAADLMFFQLMGVHHLGGVHMADAADARRSEIREFAEVVALST